MITESFVWNCSIVYYSQKFVGRRRIYPPKKLPNDIPAATAHALRTGVVRETLGVIVISFYMNLIPKSRGDTMSRVCRHNEWFGKHFEISDADVCAHMCVSEWGNIKPD